jgi:hypothetical protein
MGYDHRDYADIRRSKITDINLQAKTGVISFVYEDPETGEEVSLSETVPIKMEICPTCEGFGQYVNPNIDRNGLTSEDFDNEPGFYEDYMGGLYDITCAQCAGAKVVPAIDVDNLSPSIKETVKKYQEWIKEQEQDEAEYRRECEMERRYCGGY